MQLWTHPEFKGHYNRAIRLPMRARNQPTERSPFGRVVQVSVGSSGHAASPPRVPQSAPLSHQPGEGYSTLAIAGLCSATAAAVLACVVSFFDAQSRPVSLESLFEDSASYAALYPSDVNHEARSRFLTGLLSEDAFVRKSQVQFIAHLITSQLKNHPEPERLAHLIVSESVLANYDPFLVAAVIRSESMFRRSAVSYAGARGLMQIMPDTATFLAKREKISLGSHGLYDPRTNVRLGIAYLKYLEKMFKGNRTRALIAYNWGPANLDSALKRSASPPSSTVQYAQKILAHHQQWKQRYLRLASNSAPAVG